MQHQPDSKPGAGPSSTRSPALLLFGALLIFIVAGTSVLLWDTETKIQTQSIPLPDGTTFTLEKVKYGTSFSYDDEEAWYRRLLKKIAPPIYRRITGGRSSGHLNWSGSEPKLGVFIRHDDPSAKHDFFQRSPNWYLEAPPDWRSGLHSWSTYDPEWGKRLRLYHTTVPQTRPDLEFSLWQYDKSYTSKTLVGSFKFLNPAFTKEVPLAPPTAMPLHIKDSHLSVTLYNITTGAARPDHQAKRNEDWKQTESRLRAGNYYPVVPGEDSYVNITYHAEAPSKPLEKWSIVSMSTVDQFGSSLQSNGYTSRDLSDLRIAAFNPSLVAEAGPFEAKLGLTKTAGYDSNELFVVDSALPTTGSEPIAGPRVTVNGVLISFEGLIGADYRTTGSRQFSLSSKDHPIIALSTDAPPSVSPSLKFLGAVDEKGIIYSSMGMSANSSSSGGVQTRTFCFELQPERKDYRRPAPPMSPAGTSITLTFALPTDRILTTRFVPSVAAAP